MHLNLLSVPELLHVGLRMPQAMPRLLGLTHEFVSSVAPLVHDSLSVISADVRASKDPLLPPDILKAVNRRRVALQRGGRRGEGAAETESVFKGSTRRDRRSAKIQDADARAEEYLSKIGALDMGAEGLSAFIEGARPGPGALVARSMLVRGEYLTMFLGLCRAMLRSGGAGVSDTDGRGDSSGGSAIGGIVIGDGPSTALHLLSRAHGLCVQQPKWFPGSARDQVAMLLVDAHWVAGNYTAAMALLRRLCAQWPCSAAAWSRYCTVSARAGTVRAWRAHVEQMRKRCPQSVAIMIMQGHVHSLSRQYTEALCAYFGAYRFLPTEPLLLLCIAVTYTNLATAKRCPDRNRNVLNAFAFMQEYSRRRVESARRGGGSAATGGAAAVAPLEGVGMPLASPLRATPAALQHEAHYNTARAAHALSLNAIAHQHYALALGVAPEQQRRQQRARQMGVHEAGGAAASGGAPRDAAGSRDGERDTGGDGGGSAGACGAASAGDVEPGQLPGCASFAEQCPLSREAAHNMAMLYLNSGATELARAVYRTYLVI